MEEGESEARSEGVRHSDARDLRLVFSEIFPDLVLACFQRTLMVALALFWFHEGIRWEDNLLIFVLSGQVDLISVVHVCR